MVILTNKNSSVEGYALLWEVNKSNNLIGLNKNVFVRAGWIPTKTEKDMRINLARSKDIKIIKLRDKLFQEISSDEKVWAVIEALGEKGMTLDKFVSEIDENEEDVFAPSHKQEIVIEKPQTSFKEEEASGSDGDCNWSSHLFNSYSDEDEETDNNLEDEEEEVKISVVDDTLDSLNYADHLLEDDDVVTEPVAEDYLSGLNMMAITVGESKPTREELPRVMYVKDENSEKEMGLSDEWYVREFEKIEDQLDTLAQTFEVNTDSMSYMKKKVSDFLIKMEKFEKDSINEKAMIKSYIESILEHLTEPKPSKEKISGSFSKSISEGERKAIDEYTPDPMMIKYLRSDGAFKKQDINVKTNGLYLLDGVDDVMKNGTEGFFEFLSKYFPFVYAEYLNNILKKVEVDK